MSIITDELNKKDLSESQIYDNKINNLIVKFTNASSIAEQKQLQYQINQIKRDKSYYIFKNYIKKFLVNIFILCLFTLNLIAVSLSMSCSKGKTIFFRIISAMYAFFFSILYILINYRYYRLTIKKDTTTCNICPNNPFAI